MISAFLATPLTTIQVTLNDFAADIFAAMAIIRSMKKPSIKNEPTGYPDFAEANLVMMKQPKVTS